MRKIQFDVEATRRMLMYVSDGMIASKSRLTELDKTVGDGDHGIGMARGFEAVRQALEGETLDSIGTVLVKTGTTLLMSIGGAAGAVFGTFFRGGGAGLKETQFLDSRWFSQFLMDGLEAVKKRGGAKPGDKTMVDALEPAAAKSCECIADALDHSLLAVSDAARNGMEKTKEMVAATGKARTLGERSLGHADPGAVSTYLILKLMADFVTSPSSQ
jgi:phosphoenolpyruvate---glycerone phosphotransferase subunit DhaL